MSSKKRISYNKATFKLFVESLTRLVCDDEEIVITDLLLEDERAYTEKDLSEKLLWSDKKIREVCIGLEKQKILLRENMSSLSNFYSVSSNLSNLYSQGSALNSEHNSSSFHFIANNSGFTNELLPQNNISSSVSSNTNNPDTNNANSCSFWCINPHLPAVVKWKCDKLFSHLNSIKQETEENDSFKCTKCQKEYDGLEAQMLDLDPEDAHFLCKLCYSRLEQEDNKKSREIIEKTQERAKNQLKLLILHLDRVWNMAIPKFQPFTRAEKNELKKAANPTVSNRSTKSDYSLISEGNQLSGNKQSKLENINGNSLRRNDEQNKNITVCHVDANNVKIIDDVSDYKFNVSSASRDRKDREEEESSSILEKKTPVRFKMKIPSSVCSSHTQRNKNTSINNGRGKPSFTNTSNKNTIVSNSAKVSNQNTKEKETHYNQLNGEKSCINTEISSGSKSNLTSQCIMSSANKKSIISSQSQHQYNSNHRRNNLTANDMLANTNVIRTDPASVPNNDTVISRLDTNSTSAVNNINNFSKATIFISKYNKHFSLQEAQHMQQEMNETEFMEFSELQDAFLDDF